MRKFLTKFITLIAFILSFVLSSFAQDLGITSIIYDDSSSILTINSFDNEEYSLSEVPKIYIVEDEQKIYFDINSAIMNCPQKEFVINSRDIKQVAVKQYSKYPNVVRVVIKYSETYNPKNIRLLKVNNTLFVRFNPTRISNYYFQHVYSDDVTSINSYYETIGIETPVLKVQDSVLSQIDLAFNNLGHSAQQEYILVKNDLVLPTKYYLDSIDVKPSAIHIVGIGSLTLSKPLYLTNPTRAVFDIHGALVNSSIRNKEIQLSTTETIKIGQFDRNTARVVITSEQANNFIPIVYGDTQHFAFINKAAQNAHKTLFSSKSTLKFVNDELNDDKTHTMKLVFSKPIIYGLERHSKGLDLYLYNVDSTDNVNFKKSLIFQDARFAAIKGGGYKLSISNSDEDIINIHAGADGKTLRIREKIVRAQLPIVENNPSIIDSLFNKKTDGKYIVVIDPGHGGSDYGAIREGINEKDIVLEISNKVAELLRKKGYDVVMTRDVDATVSLQERVELSENISPQIFVSIHVNSSNSEAPNGLETHYYKENSLQLAKTVHASMLNHIYANNRGLFKSKFYVINHTTAPAILIETGFLSNPDERADIITDSRKQATAKAIAEGINDYFKELK
ncbi:MAG: N-acetylmuramoyl-L-alanine amidase [Cyanobacteria bacterium SIG26]|nr:N-acetylmuramoyl-L-alanine amidase [Cyanobacteria bacterium SIG26]